ncbi:hypothetical protein P4O66_016701 [Electrophorus voltai]|uniref:Transmembrane protein 179B n=1 Tax=Electrophorus voltai TaxID=2609070 RepID=A0AAD8YX87_9TELE|nr:hypothetical protein P4O66_016701 [Electrophorus voltai]
MLVMGLPWLVTLELVLYAGCFICGIIAAASVTITQVGWEVCTYFGEIGFMLCDGHFAGQCILYGSIHYNTSGHFLTVEISSSPSLCYFVSAISVCVAIYCFSLIFFWIYAGCVDEEVKSCEDAQNETWASPYTGNEFYSGLHSSEFGVTAAFPSPQRSVWVSIFFWLLIMAVVMVQRRQVVGENTMWSHAETEPFFRRPARNL